MVDKPNTILTNIRIDDLTTEVQDVLNEYVETMVDDFPNELPPIISISHHIDMIPKKVFQTKLLTE